MSRNTSRLLPCLFILLIHLGALASIAEAQSGLAQAVLQLPSSTFGSVRLVDGRLYGGSITATITDQDGDPGNFVSNDVVRFAIGPRGQPFTLEFTGSQAAFEDWANDNADALLAVLFPAGLASSVLGRSAGELHGQQLLLTVALDTDEIRRTSQGGRSGVGGLIEFESLRRDGRRSGDSTWAWQGLYAVNRFVSVQGRFAQQREGVTTRATAFSADYHPYIEFDRSIRWRVGGTARGGLLFSQSAAMDLGSFEFGGGGWVSAFKDLGRIRVGGGTMLQGSKSYIPGVFDGADDSLAFLAEAINGRGIQYDLTYGATAGVDTSERTAAIVKVLQNRSLSSRDQRPDSWLMLAGLSYRLGLPSVNFGYKLYSSSALRGHSVFAQGNFNW
jgi:hypothetical protein